MLKRKVQGCVHSHPSPETASILTALSGLLRTRFLQAQVSSQILRCTLIQPALFHKPEVGIPHRDAIKL
jgi:hypothetical protein